MNEFISDSSEEILEYESHILLIIKIIYQILISANSKTSVFIIINQKIFSFLNKLNTNINTF